MKIVFYCTEPQPVNMGNLFEIASNGTASNLILISHHLAKLGHEVYVLNRSPSGCFEGVDHVHTDTQEDCRRELVKLGDIDVFIANGWAASIFLNGDVILAKRRIYWLQNFIDIRRYEEAITSGRLDYIYCVSEAHLGAFWRSRNFLKFRMFYNSIHTEILKNFPLENKRENIIVFAGALREVKGYYDAVRIFKLFFARNPSYKLYIAGSAALHGRPEESQEFCKEMVDAGKIQFLGNLGRLDLYKLFSRSRLCLVNPSWISEAETFGVAAIEAQALGCPVVSTARGGLFETVCDGKSGYLIKSKHDEDMVTKMEYLLNNPDLWKKFSLFGREFILEKFDSKKIAQQCARELEKIINQDDAFEYRGYGKALKRKVMNKVHSII